MDDLSVEVGHSNGVYYKVTCKSIIENFHFRFPRLQAHLYDVDANGVDVKYDQEYVIALVAYGKEGLQLVCVFFVVSWRQKELHFLRNVFDLHLNQTISKNYQQEIHAK